MQQRGPELNQRADRGTPIALLQILAVAAAGALVEGPRLAAGPGRTLPFAAGGDPAVQGIWMLAGAGAGVGVACIGWLWRRWRSWSGVFGAVAAAVLACTLVAGVRALLGHAAPSWLTADGAFWLPVLLLLPATAAGALAGPVLRERSVFSLVWVSLVLALPLCLARQQAAIESALAAPLRALERVGPVGDQVALVLPPATPREHALAFWRSLSAPGRTVVAVPEDGAEKDWLARAGFAVLVYRGADFERRAPVPPPLRLAAGPIAVRATFEPAGDRGSQLAVVAAPVPGPLLASVLTPVGVVRFAVDDRGRGMAGAAEQQRLRDLLRPLPSGVRLRVLVVSPLSADAYGWQDVASP